MHNALVGKRVLITQAAAFMGPVLCEVLAEQGAQVVRSEAPLDEPAAARAVAAEAGAIDVLVANLALPAPGTPVLDVDEQEWRQVFACLLYTSRCV